MSHPLQYAPVLVIGAGIMGSGIAQTAAQAGHPVFLYDAREGAAVESRTKLATTLNGLVAKGRLEAAAAEAAIARITPINTLTDAATARLAIEAIVELLEPKRELFRQLEAILADDAVLGTNTSSISVTAIAAGLKHPGRLAGMHFFNPVALMKLVEIVSGLQTDPQVAASLFDLAALWGKVPVHAKSTPGFVVNRIARPFYAEALALLQEQAAGPEVLDACLKAAGFRMGPCELMDLIGHDTNLAVTRSVFEANFFDKRYQPSVVQSEMVAGGLLGRKSGRGFYSYPQGAAALPAADRSPPDRAVTITLHGQGALADALGEAAARVLGANGTPLARDMSSDPTSHWIGLEIDGARLVLTQGLAAWDLAARSGVTDTAVFDRPLRLPMQPGQIIAYSVNAAASAAWQGQAGAWLQALGFAPQRVSDAPGLVVARTVAMLINEAADAVLQGVCTTAGADSACKLGVNYPAGPFEWLREWSVPGVIAVLESLDSAYRGERYRVSPWLRRGVAS